MNKFNIIKNYTSNTLDKIVFSNKLPVFKCNKLQFTHFCKYKYYILQSVIKGLSEYFTNYNIELINLDKLDSSSDLYYWNICKNTGKIYIIKFI